MGCLRAAVPAGELHFTNFTVTGSASSSFCFARLFSASRLLFPIRYSLESRLVHEEDDEEVEEDEEEEDEDEEVDEDEDNRFDGFAVVAVEQLLVDRPTIF